MFPQDPPLSHEEAHIHVRQKLIEAHTWGDRRLSPGADLGASRPNERPARFLSHLL